jgi:hypothetical protein
MPVEKHTPQISRALLPLLGIKRKLSLYDFHPAY